MGSLRFFSHRATLAAPPSKVAAAAAEAAKAAPLLLLLLLPVLLAVVRVQDVYEADPVFRAAAALRVETAISRPFKYWKYLGRCIGVLDERKTMHMRSRCGRAPLLILAPRHIWAADSYRFGQHIMCRWLQTNAKSRSQGHARQFDAVCGIRIRPIDQGTHANP